MRLDALTGRLAVAGMLAATLFSGLANAGGGVVRDARLWTAPDNTRLVFDLNRSIDYRLFRLHSPERIVLDMNDTEMQADLAKLPLPDPRSCRCPIPSLRLSGTASPSPVSCVW